MPHKQCSVCVHKDLEAIDADRDSVRAVAKRFGLSPAAVDRHRHHDEHDKKRQNTGQIAEIALEIRRLKRAQTAARKRRDSAAFVRLSAELRQWHTLKAKLLGSMVPEKDAPEASVSERDALQMAMAIIEANLTGDQRQLVLEWLNGLNERLRPPDAVPAEQSSGADGSEELPELRDTSGTVEIDSCKALEKLDLACSFVAHQIEEPMFYHRPRPFSFAATR
jgi:hypothetical protein